MSALMQARGVARAFSATLFRRSRTLHAVNGVDLTIEHLPPEVLREALAMMTGLYCDPGAGHTSKAAP